MIGQQILGLVAVVAVSILLALSLAWPRSVILGGGVLVVFFGACILSAALMARRAHDIGWPSFIPIVAVAIAVTPLFFLLVLNGAVGATASEFAGSLGLGSIVRAPLLIGSSSPASILLLVLMFKMGEPAANRFGDVPR